jgi:hypothetical protein
MSITAASQARSQYFVEVAGVASERIEVGASEGRFLGPGLFEIKRLLRESCQRMITAFQLL